MVLGQVIASHVIAGLKAACLCTALPGVATQLHDDV